MNGELLSSSRFLTPAQLDTEVEAVGRVYGEFFPPDKPSLS
jgi:hypothetical protein